MRSATLFIGLFTFWVLLSGHFQFLLIGQGLLYCGLVTGLARRWRNTDPAISGRQLLALGRYLPWLVWKVVLANLQVARLVWHPRLPISPRLIEVPHGLHTALGQTIYANSITLTPGTVTVHITSSTVTVHALTESAADELLEGEMERRIARLEDPLERVGDSQTPLTKRAP